MEGYVHLVTTEIGGLEGESKGVQIFPLKEFALHVTAQRNTTFCELVVTRHFMGLAGNVGYVGVNLRAVNIIVDGVTLLTDNGKGDGEPSFMVGYQGVTLIAQYFPLAGASDDAAPRYGGTSYWVTRDGLGTADQTQGVANTYYIVALVKADLEGGSFVFLHEDGLAGGAM